VPLAFLGVFFVWPVLAILDVGLRPGGDWDLRPITDVLTDAGLRGTLWFTVWQAALSTALTLLVALPGAYVVARLRFPGRDLVRALVVVPFVLPTVVVAAAFVALDVLPPLWAILAAHVFFNYAVVVRTVGGLWAHLDPRLEEAARVLGANRWRTFREVSLPLLRPAIASASAIVFLFTFTSFGIVRILGANRYATVEVEIVRATRDLFDLRLAAGLAVVQLAAVVALLVVLARLGDRGAVGQRLHRRAATARRPSTVGERVVLVGTLTLMAVLLGTPLVTLVERSLHTGDGYGLAWYRRIFEGGDTILFVPAWEAVRNSLVYGLAATVIAVAIGGAAAFALVARRRSTSTRALDVLLMLPLGTSAVTVGFGFLVGLDQAPLDLRSSVVLVPIAHALVAVPFVVRVMTPVLRAIDPRLREAAAALGAPPHRVWREVDLPIVSRALAVAAGFAFAVSLGEFGATLLIARADRPTMPVAIFRYLGQPGAASAGQAMAMSVLLMVVVAAAVLAIDRLRVGELGAF
jgi:thiamine transport system permease protein